MKKTDKTTAPGKNGFAEPSLQQWNELFEIAGVIKTIQPWKSYYETDIFTFLFPGRAEPVYISILGNGGECLQINVYPDNKAMAGFFELRGVSPSEPFAVTMGRQSCLTACFGDRDEVTADDRAVYAKLGLKFRGKGQWIYFRAMEPGFSPWKIDAQQAALLVEALKNFLQSYHALAEGSVKVDFEKNETLVRQYDPEKKLWFNTAREFPPFAVKYETVTLTDEIFIESLKKSKQSQGGLSLDLFYVPTPIQDKPGIRPYFPRMILLADDRSGMILDQKILSPKEEAAEELLNLLAGAIFKHGRPLTLRVRGDAVAAYVEDLCDKINVRLIKNQGIPVIDEYIDSMMEMLRI